MNALPDSACSPFAAKNPAAFRVWAACVKLCDSWGGLYHSAADIGEAMKLHRANVGAALRSLIEAGWIVMREAAAGKANTYQLVGPNADQPANCARVYVMSNSPASGEGDAQAQQGTDRAPDAQAQQSAGGTEAGAPDAQAQHYLTRTRNSIPDAQAQQPVAQAQQPVAPAQQSGSPLEPSLRDKTAADRPRTHASGRTHTRESGPELAAATAGKIRGDGKPRHADRAEFSDTTDQAHPLAFFLGGFLSAEQREELLRTHGPDRILRALEIGAAAAPDEPWHYKRLRQYANEHSGEVVPTIEQKTRSIRACAPVASHNAERFARKHPGVYINTIIREKQAEAKARGVDARVTPEKLVLALKCNDAGWTVAKHLAVIQSRARAELERIHSGQHDRTARSVEKGRDVIAQAESNAQYRARHRAAIEGLTDEQRASVRAIVRGRISTPREVRAFENDPEALSKPVYAALVIDAAALVRSGDRHIVPQTDQ